MCNVEVRGLKYGAQADCSIARGKAYAVMDQLELKECEGGIEWDEVVQGCPGQRGITSEAEEDTQLKGSILGDAGMSLMRPPRCASRFRGPSWGTSIP